MKKLTVILILLSLLCGCAGKEEAAPSVPAETVPVLTDTETEPAPPATEGDGLIREPDMESAPEPPAPGQHQAAYSILENDHSIRGDDGDILVKIEYSQIILDTSRQEWDQINRCIAEDYREFLADMAYLADTPVQQWEQMIRESETLYGNFLSVRTPEVTCNSGGIFSIRMTWEWFMGGVYNCDSYGLNFDLTTGEMLPLARLSELPEEEFLAQLKSIAAKKLEENRDALLEDPAAILEEYNLEDFSFCMEKGELVLLVPTYTFGPGVLGATEVKTGLYPVL